MAHPHPPPPAHLFFKCMFSQACRRAKSLRREGMTDSDFKGAEKKNYKGV